MAAGHCVVVHKKSLLFEFMNKENTSKILKTKLCFLKDDPSAQNPLSFIKFYLSFIKVHFSQDF